MTVTAESASTTLPLAPAGHGLVVVLSGPSGVGKNTVGDVLLERHDTLDRGITMTTRRPRTGEVQGVDYQFVDPQEFERAWGKGELLERATIHGNLYGLPWKSVRDRRAEGLHTLLVIDVQGAMNVKKVFPEAITIFLEAPNWAELERRLRTRDQDDDAAIRTRLETAETELTIAPEYDYRVMNDSVDVAADAIDTILRTEYDRIGAS